MDVTASTFDEVTPTIRYKVFVKGTMGVEFPYCSAHTLSSGELSPLVRWGHVYGPSRPSEMPCSHDRTATSSGYHAFNHLEGAHQYSKWGLASESPVLARVLVWGRCLPWMWDAGPYLIGSAWAYLTGGAYEFMLPLEIVE